jgi:hypothetical protein
MGIGCYGLIFRPGEQLIGRDESLAHFASLAGNNLNAFHEFLWMSEKEIQVEAAGGVQRRNRFFEKRAFVSISSTLLAFREVQLEFRRSGCLSHLLLLLSNTL